MKKRMKDFLDCYSIADNCADLIDVEAGLQDCRNMLEYYYEHGDDSVSGIYTCYKRRDKLRVKKAKLIEKARQNEMKVQFYRYVYQNGSKPAFMNIN